MITSQELRYKLPLLVLCVRSFELNHHPGRDGQNDLVGTPSGSYQGSAVRLRMKVSDELAESGESIFHSNVWTEETSWQEASSF